MRLNWVLIDIFIALILTGVAWLLSTFGIITITVSYGLVYILSFLLAGISRVYIK